MFLSIDGQKELTEKFIDRVVYYLHPSYEIRKIEKKEYPYLISRTAYCKFVIGVEINFKLWTTLKPIRIDHLLKLEEEG